MSKYKATPDKQFVYEQAKLDLYHEWTDMLEVWSDEADDLGMKDQWQRDSYLYAQTVKFMDTQRPEAELQRQIAGNQL